MIDMNNFTNPSFKNVIFKDFIFYYMALGPLVILTLTLLAYNDPEYGFATTFPYTPLTVIFPIIWLAVYVLAKKRIHQQKYFNQQNTSNGGIPNVK